MKKTFYVSNFPINKLSSYGEESWVLDLTHIRNQYRYLEAIVEDIKNSHCEPILITESGNDYLSGPHGVNRLIAIIKHTDWTTIPVILNTESIPSFIDNATLISNIDELAAYFKRNLKDPNVADIEFSDRGVSISTWSSFQPSEIMKSFKASNETKERILELFAIEQIENNTLKIENITQEQLEKWTTAWKRWKNVQTNI